MYHRAWPVLLLLGVAGAPASSQAILKDSKAFIPYSKTAIAVTGPVILSTDRMVFETGSSLDLEVVDQVASGDWGASGDVRMAQLFRVSGNAGPLRRGNTLCGDQPITYMAAWNEESSGFEYLGIAMFTSPDLPSGVGDRSMCATYFYSIDPAN